MIIDDKEFAERVFNKQDEIFKELTEVRVILAKQEESLHYHIYRTDQNELSINELKKSLDPIAKHLAFVQGFIKLMGILATGVGMVLGIMKLLGKI